MRGLVGAYVGGLVLCLVAGCGSTATMTVTAPSRQQAPAAVTSAGPALGQRVTAGGLLRRWDVRIEAVFDVLKRRRDALKHDDPVKQATATVDLPRRLKPLLKFGTQGRGAFLDDEPSAVTRAVVAAGDAWSRWAFVILDRRGSVIDWGNAQRIADLAAVALRRHRAAYRAARIPVPPIYRRG